MRKKVLGGTALYLESNSVRLGIAYTVIVRLRIVHRVPVQASFGY